MATKRMQYVDNRKELNETVNHLISQKYEVKDSTPFSVTLKKRNYGSLVGHLIVLILTGWWTFGIFNLIYALCAKGDADKVEVHIAR
jgi:hypothetical protein